MNWCLNIASQESVGVKDTTDIVPNKYTLFQNYPNPFNPVTNIKYSIAVRRLVQLKIYNLLGKEVETLVNEQQNAGEYTAVFNASSLSSVIYFYKLTAGDFTEVKKIIETILPSYLLVSRIIICDIYPNLL